MGIQIEASYSKKLGLPNFSSHSFMITVRAEVSSLRRLESESSRLYRLLQESVDRQVKEVGFLPDGTTYGMLQPAKPVNGSVAEPANSKPVSGANGAWHCSDKQRGFIERTAKRMRLSAGDLDHVANDLFKLPASQLDKRQASRLIDELFAIDGRPAPGQNTNGSAAPAAAN